jgi:pentatricopeptide repeat protein
MKMPCSLLRRLPCTVIKTRYEESCLGQVDRGKRSLLAKEALKLWALLELSSEATYTSMVTLLSRGGDLERAVNIPHEMKQRGLKPKIGIYAALIRGCTLSQRPLEALKVYEIMKCARIKPDLHLLASLTLAQPDIVHVDKFHQQVKAEFGYFQPDVVLFNAMVKVASLSDGISRCYDLISEMKIQGCRPDVYTYQSLLHCLARRGELDECRRVVRAHIPRVVSETVSSLVHASINGDHKPETILATLSEFKHIRPNDQLISALYQAASRLSTDSESKIAKELVHKADRMTSK